MAANLENRFSAQGINPIEINQGLQIFGELLPQEIGQVGVLSVNWPKFLSCSPLKLPLFSEQVQESQESEGLPTSKYSLVSEWQQASSNEDRLLLLRVYLQGITAKILGISPEQINLDQSLRTLGFDSLMAVEMRTKLSVDLGVDIPLIKFAEEVTVASVAILVDEQLRALIPVPPSNDDEQISEEILTQLSQLTDGEIDSLLSSLLSN